jgi:hypothetical protein
MTHILILTPSLGRVSLGYRDTFARLMLECARREIKLSINDVIDPGLLPHARNVLLAAALDSDASHVFWWDADVAFDVLALLDLVDCPAEMICRPYPMRGHDFQAQRDWLLDEGNTDATMGAIPSMDELRNATILWSAMLDYVDGKPVWTSDRKLVRLRHCGFGWVLMKGEAVRQAFSVSTKKDWHGRRYHTMSWHTPPGGDGRRLLSATAFNHAENEQGMLMGEDVSFCASWRRLDRMIWAAPDAVVTNGGRSGRFADYLEQHGFMGSRISPAI